MTWSPDVVVDTAELRVAAAAIRRAAADSSEVRLRLPGEVWGAPDWLAADAASELGYLRGSLDELRGELLAEASRLEARADEVEHAEQRWATVANGALVCGCVLPTGEIVATTGAGTAASAASGPGVAQAITVGAVGLAASGGGVAGTGVDQSVFTVGGGGLGGAFTVVQPAIETATSTPGVVVIGGGGSLNPGFTVIQPALEVPLFPVTMVGGNMGGLVSGSALANASADEIERRILAGGFGGGATSTVDIVGYTQSMQMLTTAMGNASHYNMPGSGMTTYKDSVGAFFNAYPSDERAVGAYRP